MNKVLKILGLTALAGGIGYLAYKYFIKPASATTPTNNGSANGDVKVSTGGNHAPTITRNTDKLKTLTVRSAAINYLSSSPMWQDTLVTLNPNYKNDVYKKYNLQFTDSGNLALRGGDFCLSYPCPPKVDGKLVEITVRNGDKFVIKELYRIEYGRYPDYYLLGEWRTDDLGSDTWAILDYEKNPILKASGLPNDKVYALNYTLFTDLKSSGEKYKQSIKDPTAQVMQQDMNPFLQPYLQKATTEYTNFISGKGWDGDYSFSNDTNFFMPTNATEAQIAAEATRAWNSMMQEDKPELFQNQEMS